MRILVTGSRHADGVDHRRTIRQALNDTVTDFGDLDVTLVHGKCPYGGADLIAHHCAAESSWAIEAYPADWDTHGKAAGMIRNGQMVAAGADICLAFPGRTSRGTWDCIRKAAGAGIHTRIYPLKDCR